MQQDIAMLVNLRKEPKVNYTDLWKEKITLPDFWSIGHWKGKDELLEKRLASFEVSMTTYSKNN